MNVAIIHFHLNRGGVTQVILNHLHALDAARDKTLRVAVLYGGRSEGIETSSLQQYESIDVSLHPIAELDYDETPTAAPERLFECFHQSLSAIGFDSDSTLLHVHNHALGKNVSLPGALRLAARKRYRLLLQIHDFAEDFRPDNYCRLLTALADGDHARLPACMYPQAAQIHYAVLNQRDVVILRTAGVAPDNLHLLPNPTSGVSGLIPRSAAKKELLDRWGVPLDTQYLLYPVRGIRRKNIGEALLWSALGGKQVRVGITLPPLNPLERQSYDRWKSFARKIGSSCLFETGGEGGLDFAVNMSAADMILTTSVAEGFGMVFLECWLAGRRLVGRDLPEITSDFKESGIDLRGMYDRLRVPRDWIDDSRWRSSLQLIYQRAQKSFGTEGCFEQALNERMPQLVQDDYFDFAQLDSTMQQIVIRRILDDGASESLLLDANPSIASALSSTPDETFIARNAQAVRSGFAELQFGRDLATLYNRIMSSPTDMSITALANGPAILESLLDLARLHPIRLEQ